MALNNTYRLLQGYRSHGFFGYTEADQDGMGISHASPNKYQSRNIGQMKLAIDLAFETVFPGESVEEAVDKVAHVLRQARNNYAEITFLPDYGTVKLFFETLAEFLAAA